MADFFKDRHPAFRPFYSLPFFDDDFFDMERSYSSGLSVSEDKDHVFIEAHLPGLKAEDIDISFERGVLWIRGEKKQESEDKQKRYYRKASSSFSYRLQLPVAVDEGKDPEATYKDGVMKISFFKGGHGKSKKINIKT